MSEWIWMILCVFAAIGAAQCISWAAALRRPRMLRHGYHVFTLYDDPVRIEAELRGGLSRLGWDRCGSPVVILADTGLGEECAAICDRFTQEHPGLMRCGLDEIPGVIRDLDRLQEVDVFPTGEHT